MHDIKIKTTGHRNASIILNGHEINNVTKNVDVRLDIFKGNSAMLEIAPQLVDIELSDTKIFINLDNVAYELVKVKKKSDDDMDDICKSEGRLFTENWGCNE